jgi:hypothetical protein
MLMKGGRVRRGEIAVELLLLLIYLGMLHWDAWDVPEHLALRIKETHNVELFSEVLFAMFPLCAHIRIFNVIGVSTHPTQQMQYRRRCGNGRRNAKKDGCTCALNRDK